MNPDRRTFLRTATGAAAAFTFASLRDDWTDHVRAANQEAGNRPPEKIAGHEPFWFHVQQAFDIDRSIINLNSGGVSPSPRIVHDAMVRQLAQTNHAPSRQLWTVQDPQVELVRERLARVFGCDREEMAITRNASESLQIALNGIDLKPGDEILTSTQDYPRMINTIRQRAAREDIVLKQVRLPVPITSHDEVLRLFEAAITPRTRAMLFCHVINLTGELMPVRRLCEMARSRGIVSIVDGAHAFAHVAFDGGAIGCDYYATSLHKWLTAPIGTGFLHVRRERIRDHWPLTAADDPRSDNIRKFEEIGTHPTAPRLAIAEALTFYQGLGPQRKQERLRYLRDYWVGRLKNISGIVINTNLAPEHSCGIANFRLASVESSALVDVLWARHKIVVCDIRHDDVQGIRVTPNVFTTPAELDLFCDAVAHVARAGISKP